MRSSIVESASISAFVSASGVPHENSKNEKVNTGIKRSSEVFITAGNQVEFLCTTKTKVYVLNNLSETGN